YVVVGIVLYWFWAFPYRAALNYREEMQLFQTGWSYFSDLAGRPAGMATYAGEFLTQFFCNYWIGSLVMTVLLLLFLLLCSGINRKFTVGTTKVAADFLALLPLAAMWLCLGNATITLSFVVAMICSLAAAYSFKVSSPWAARYLWMILGTAFLYWLAGPAVIVFTLLISALVWKNGKSSPVGKITFTVVSILWLAANVMIWSRFMPYPLSYQLIGIGYAMTPDTLDKWLLITESLCVIVPIAVSFIGDTKQKIVLPAILAVVAVVSVIFYPKSYDKLTYRILDYDYLVRANDWEGILEYSDKHNPNLPLSVCATNLALGMTGQLDSRAFDYYQNTAEGLFPSFVKETLSSWTGGEVAFQLGMINTAQRFYFEGMEAIPNYNKSARALKRMAQTAIIRGDYEIARKYLGLLEKTLFYKKWAKENLELVKNPEHVAQHQEYGSVRAKMIDEQYMFSEGELDKTFGQLYIKNPNNTLAIQYLIVYPLLQRDLNKFVQYMGVVAEQQPSYNPLLAQQAMAFISMKNGQPIPRQIVPAMVEQSLREFAMAWTSKDPVRIEPYKRTLYHYLISDK
ncbi:MAG: hypothetical protein K2G13_08065, partial [Muribaculaceae bacterium]|nr:hypothetical protein [Muribaculaceae bacterium]